MPRELRVGTTAHAELSAPSWMATPATKVWSEVTIQKAVNGFIVHVGCKVFVAEDWRELSKGLLMYWKDPIAAEKHYCKEDMCS